MGSGEGSTMRNFIVCNVHLYDYIVMVMESRTMRWAGHLARMKEGITAFIFLTGKLTGETFRMA